MSCNYYNITCRLLKKLSNLATGNLQLILKCVQELKNSKHANYEFRTKAGTYCTNVLSGKLIISLWSQASKRSTNINRGNGELLELRLLETGFLSRFQNKMSRF
jgi:hypothetical protein